MINIAGLRKADILAALAAEAGGCEWKPMNPIDAPACCYSAVVNGCIIVLDLHADDSFDETDYNRVCGWRAAQRAVDKLRTEKGAFYENDHHHGRRAGRFSADAVQHGDRGLSAFS